MRKLFTCLFTVAALLAADSRLFIARERGARHTDEAAHAHAASPAAAAARTTWSPHDVVCPVCKTKNTFMQIMSFGTYIYSRPSRFQYIFWPLTDGNVLYSCKKCRLTAFMGDYEKLPADRLPALRQMLEGLPAARPFERYTDVPMSERLAVAEKVYGVLGGRDDDWWCMFRRVQGYHFQAEKKQAEADDARRKALSLAEKMLSDKANEDRRKELLLVAGAMKYFLDDERAALADFDAALKLKYRDARNPQGAENLDGYLSKLLEDYVAAINDEIKARAEPVWPHRTLEEHEAWVWAAAFSADGRAVASGDTKGVLFLRDAATGAVRHRVQNRTTIQSVAFSPDGKTIAAGGYAGMLNLWDAETGKLRRELDGHADHVSAVAFSPDGKLFASGSWDDTVKLWDASAWKVLRTLKLANSVWDMAFSHDGASLATTDFEGEIRMWDARTGAVRWKLAPDKSHSFVALSPRGGLLATGGAAGEVVLLDAATGSVVRKLAGHKQTPSAVAFSPDGRRLASAAWDGTLRLWDVEAGAQLQVLTERGHHFRVVLFSPDGQTVATGGDDRTFRLWDVRPGAKPQVAPPVVKTPKIKATQ